MNKTIQIIAACFFLSFSSVYADIERVSVSSSGEQANDRSSEASSSADGRFQAFSSFATNLVVDDTNGRYDVFIHDRQTGLTERVSLSSTGEQGNNESYTPDLSADGRFVSFHSKASNLVPDDVNDKDDIFIHDRQTGITDLVSVSSTGTRGNGHSNYHSISADGRFVAFSSSSSNLVPDDTNGTLDIFIRDRQAGHTELLSLSSTGVQGNSASYSPTISPDGRFVSFTSTSTNLVANDSNGFEDVFIHDRETGVTELVSVSSTGEQGNSWSDYSTLSADGRLIVFESKARNLVPGGTRHLGVEIYIHDRQTGVTERAALTSTGEPANVNSVRPILSADGRFVVFTSAASNLVPGDSNGDSDIYVYDRQSGQVVRVSVSSTGEQGNNDSFGPAFSSNGRFIAFTSRTSNLVADDTNGVFDIFTVENPLVTTENDLVLVEKLINNSTRNTSDSAAQLATGTLYKQSYKVTNNSTNRIYQVKVYEGGNLVCNFYSLNSGETKERCISFNTVLEGDQHTTVNLSAKVSGSNQDVTVSTDAYYTGLTNTTGELVVTHRINNINADTEDQAPTLNTQPVSVLFKVENTGNTELYQVKTYHDPVSPVNSGWALQCVLGPMKPGQVRYCKKDLTFTNSGLNQAMGRVQGRNAIRSATEVINASNATYFIAP